MRLITVAEGCGSRMVGPQVGNAGCVRGETGEAEGFW